MRASYRQVMYGLALGLLAVVAAGPPRAVIAQTADEPPLREESRRTDRAITGPARQTAEEPPPREKPLASEPDDVGIAEPEAGPEAEPGAELEDLSGPDGRSDRRYFEPSSEKDWPRIRDFIEENFPEWAGELRRLEVVNQRLFRVRLREIAPRVIGLMQELEQDEELGRLAIDEERLELEIRRAVRAWLDASEPAEQDRLKGELEGMIRRQFEIRQQRGQRAVEKLEARLDRMRQRLEHRGRQADEIIRRQLEELLTPPEPGELRPGDDRPGGPRGPRDQRWRRGRPE